MATELDQSAVIYCRVSSAAQVKRGDGLGSQETRCREYAAGRGYKVVEVFHDEGVSGSLINRPGMIAMLSFLKKHRRYQDHIVIIDDISRLARGLEAHIQLRTAIGAAGGKLVSPSIEFGDDSDSMLVENLLASVSQHQRQKNAEQVVNRMRARMLNGYYVFKVPFAYRWERVAGHGKMIVRNEPFASILQEGLEGFASGRFGSIFEVKAFFETHPTWPRHRNGEVHPTVVKDLLSRPVYAGYLEAPNWQVSLQPGKHEALVDFETWQKIQRKLKGRPIVPTRKDLNEDFPLRGFVTCACCDQPMTAAWSKGRNARYPYYFCMSRSCPDYRKSVRAEKMQGDFEELLKALQPTPNLFAMIQEMLRDLWIDRQDGASKRAADYRAELAKTERKLEQLVERIVNTDSPALVGAYENQVRRLEEERITLGERSKNAGRPQMTFDDTFRTACAFLANPYKLWVSDHVEDKRMVLKLAFAGKLAYMRNEGFRTAILPLPFKVLGLFRGAEKGLVGPPGLEPGTRPLWPARRREAKHTAHNRATQGKWWAHQDSNLEPDRYERSALTIEL
jgi:site-specific DNA recombinase